MALVVSHDLRAGGGHVLLGSALVFASAVSYAVYLLRAGPLLARLGSARVAAWATVIACVLALAQFLLLRPVAATRGAALAGSGPERGDGGVLHRTADLAGVRGDTPARRRAYGDDRFARTGVTLLLAWLLLGEALGVLQLLGAALVIAGYGSWPCAQRSAARDQALGQRELAREVR